MSEYVKVYDHNGELFEVSHEKAADLVLNKGWSKNPPAKAISAAPVAPAPQPAAQGNLADQIIARAEAHIADAPKT
jgi:hypothetical protein